MARKKRILFVNEASFLSTGYSVYGYEVIKRLHKTGKYDIAELGCYVEPNDPRIKQLPWKFYCNAPSKNNAREMDVFNKKMSFEFGEFRFEQTCLEFRPDIVIDIRDWWMMEFEERSPFRDFFHWSIMPTVDSAPQEELWLNTFLNANSVFTYSDWGYEVLKKEGGGKIALEGVAPPAVDLETFVPVKDKRAHRRKFGFDDNSFVVGTIMRNQKRKLYPDLIDSFKNFLNTASNEVTGKTYLYMHLAYPDIGWNIPRLIKEAGIGHRTLFTYICRQCGAAYPSFFADAVTQCKSCGAFAAGMPNTKTGVTRQVLSQIINIFDVYVQYSICEGFGMPQLEAAACGVPVMSVDYSAMSDVIRKIGGYPIKVQRMFREAETHAYRAYPDNNDFILQLNKFLSLPESVRMRKGYETRKKTEKNYKGWEETARKWEESIDKVEVIDHSLTWESPPRIFQPRLDNIPQQISNDDFVNWAIVNVLGMPHLTNTYFSLRLARDLNYGFRIDQYGGIFLGENTLISSKQRHQEFNRDILIRDMIDRRTHFNIWEARRCGIQQ